MYIEYAFLENFLLDGTLLFLAMRFSGCRLGGRLALSAALGACGAVLFPLLSLSVPLALCYKLCLGLALPLLATKKGEGRKKTGLCTALFFAFSFLTAGGVFALSYFCSVQGGFYLNGIPVSALTVTLLAVFCFLAETAKALKKRKNKAQFLVRCSLDVGEKALALTGFVDTGNLAEYSGAPVCFVAPQIFALALLGREEKRRYASIKTVAGEKKISVVKIPEIRITDGGQTHIIKGIYLSPSLAVSGREYEILLGAWAYP